MTYFDENGITGLVAIEYNDCHYNVNISIDYDDCIPLNNLIDTIYIDQDHNNETSITIPLFVEVIDSKGGIRSQIKVVFYVDPQTNQAVWDHRQVGWGWFWFVVKTGYSVMDSISQALDKFVERNQIELMYILKDKFLKE